MIVIIEIVVKLLVSGITYLLIAIGVFKVLHLRFKSETPILIEKYLGFDKTVMVKLRWIIFTVALLHVLVPNAMGLHSPIYYILQGKTQPSLSNVFKTFDIVIGIIAVFVNFIVKIVALKMSKNEQLFQVAIIGKAVTS